MNVNMIFEKKWKVSNMFHQVGTGNNVIALPVC